MTVQECCVLTLDRGGNHLSPSKERYYVKDTQVVEQVVFPTCRITRVSAGQILPVLQHGPKIF